MVKELDLQRYSVRTDLALEAREMAQPSGDKEQAIPGVQAEVIKDKDITITKMHIQNEQGALAIGKMIGHYVTIEVPKLREQDTTLQERVADQFAIHFEAFLERISISPSAKVLIVGLGNWNVTPDALGPLVVENIMVTRHYFELMPEDVSPGYRPVSAVAPGVLGVTGIESSDVVQGIVDQTKPELIIAIDALASRAVERVNTTIQIADTGINPGSGIGNKRKGITKEILGVPVIAIGVPTVVYASTIVNDAIDMMRNHVSKEKGNTDHIFGMMNQMSEQERLQLVKEVLDPMGHDLLVTPKEIDQFMEDIANIIATGLNTSLHEAVTPDNAGAYTH